MCASGLEDNLYLGKGQLAPSNAALVAKIRHILEELSYRHRQRGRGARHAGDQGCGKREVLSTRRNLALPRLGRGIFFAVREKDRRVKPGEGDATA